MSSPIHSFGHKSRLVLSMLALGLGLAACGGGDDAPSHAAGTDTSAESNGTAKPATSAADANKLPVSIEPCPVGYYTLNFDNSSISAKTYTFGHADAAFSFVNLSTPMSFLVCMGKPSAQLSQAGYQVLSETYDLRVTTSTTAKADSMPLSSLLPKFAIKFKLAGLPTALTTAELSSKIGLYTVDGQGAWQALPSALVDIQPDGAGGSAESSVKAPVYPVGQFVVAYKP